MSKIDRAFSFPVEPVMNKPFQMPLAASGYPDAHPYPCALRRIAVLEKMVLSGVIVQIADLTRYTTSPYGGMKIDRQHGPWVSLLDVMGSARTPHQFTRDAAETFAQELIAKGWHNGDEACVDGLQDLLLTFLAKHVGGVKA